MASVRAVMILAVLGAMLLAGGCYADSRGTWGVPPPGFAYGGLPYGSVSGGVANFYAGSDRGAVLPFMGARAFGGGFNNLRR